MSRMSSDRMAKRLLTRSMSRRPTGQPPGRSSPLTLQTRQPISIPSDFATTLYARTHVLVCVILAGSGSCRVMKPTES